MSTLDTHQQEIAAILFSLPEANHYALAGGAALIAHKAIDRQTRDLDATRRTNKADLHHMDPRTR